MSENKRTPLYDSHKELGARFTGFGGWEMPVQYSGVVDEHNATRNAAGLFDVSHMGEIHVSGKNALDALQHLTSNDVSKLVIGSAQYSLLLNEDGGVVDDIIVYKLADEEYLLCVNAANTDKDFSWLTKNNQHDALIEDKSSSYAQIAVQGPKARKIVSDLLEISDDALSEENFPGFTFEKFQFFLAGKETSLLLAATGYTGEDGFEIFCDPEDAPSLWDALIALGEPEGLKPVGLGARDSLRLEVCYPLHGHELRDDVPASVCSVSWVISKDKDYLGKAALDNQIGEKFDLRLVGLEVVDRGIVREGAKLFSSDGDEIGWVASGTKPPTVAKAVGLAFVNKEFSKVGTEFLAEVRGKKLAVKVIKKPFYRRAK